MVKPVVRVFAVRETPEEISAETLAEHVAQFLANGGQVYYAKEGESGVSLKVGVPLGIRSRGNQVERDTIAPKKGYLIPNKL